MLYNIQSKGVRDIARLAQIFTLVNYTGRAISHLLNSFRCASVIQVDLKLFCIICNPRRSV